MKEKETKFPLFFDYTIERKREYTFHLSQSKLTLSSSKFKKIKKNKKKALESIATITTL